MLGTARLLTFSFRALILVLLISMLWLSVAEPYNEALVSLSNPLLPEEASTRVQRFHIVFETLPVSGKGERVSIAIDGFTLHYGLILMAVLVLAAVGIGVIPRLAWLVALVAGAFGVHVVGVALLARGFVWTTGASSPEDTGRLVLSMFAVFWGLLPAAVGGAWCFLYWIPRVSSKPPQGDSSGSAAEAPPRDLSEDQPQSAQN